MIGPNFMTYQNPLRAVWGEVRLWLLRKLADGRMVILNAPIIGPGSHDHMWSGQWIVVADCCIAPDWDADNPVYKQWEAEHPKAGHLVKTDSPAFVTTGAAPGPITMEYH